MAIEDELSGLNRELSMFPSRAFEFEAAGTVVIEQVSSVLVRGVRLYVFVSKTSLLVHILV